MLGSNEEAHGVEALVLKEKFAASPDATTPDALDIKNAQKRPSTACEEVSLLH